MSMNPTSTTDSGSRKKDGAGADAGTSAINEEEHSLVRTLRQIDPILQFLTRATGLIAVPVPTLVRALPSALVRDNKSKKDALRQDLQQLIQLGILSCSRRCRQDQDPNDDDDLYRSFRNKKRQQQQQQQQRVDDETTTSTTTTPVVLPLSWDDATCCIGFPAPDAQHRLHGSTKTAAKRRVAALRRMMLQASSANSTTTISSSSKDTITVKSSNRSSQKEGTSEEPAEQLSEGALRGISEAGAATTTKTPNDDDAGAIDYASISMNETHPLDDHDDDNEHFSGRCTPEIPIHKQKNYNDDDLQFTAEEDAARRALKHLFGFTDNGNVNKSSDAKTNKNTTSLMPTTILPRQASYAGSNPAQQSVYKDLSSDCLEQIPEALLQAFGLIDQGRKLYSHQAGAIEAALTGQHCSVCTGTGSGKSLCFLLPVLTAAYNHNQTSILLFPTKALAQDQLSKLQALLAKNHLSERIRPATLDGDTPHSLRSVMSQCNVILTNPDTLHAAVLPSWKSSGYKPMLAALRFIVVDEAHTYDGIFGAHVAMILRRLIRVSAIAAIQNNGKSGNIHSEQPTFFAASATLPWPEHHFRLLFPIPAETPVKVLTSEQDGSPRSAKHFFVWNPPVLNMDGTSTGQVFFPRPTKANTSTDASDDGKSKTSSTVIGKKRPREVSPTATDGQREPSDELPTVATLKNYDSELLDPKHVPAQAQNRNEVVYHRQHAADETARLLARTIANGTRCIAFCKTRNLVEWVYSKALDVLKRDPHTAHLASRVESYRGGYNMAERRKIEERLFNNELLGVVGTNALELGVDLGGIDLTLHCGYPSSYSSLLQQAGRAGRGKDKLDTASVSVVVCFNSPSEQQIWRRPASLLGKGLTPRNTIPLRGDLVQSHLLCASEEFPLSGQVAVTTVAGSPEDSAEGWEVQSDRDLFGRGVYEQAIDALQSTGSVIEKSITVDSTQNSKVSIFEARPSLRKAWSRVSIRSIEPVNYAVVDLSHPGQGGRTDSIHDDSAILDTLPYSRVFYHAHPGSIITHRGRKYKIVAMTRPPAFIANNFGYRRSNLNLAAFAKPTSATYLTRPLSKMFITVVKQMEAVELRGKARSMASSSADNDDETAETDGESVLTFAGCGAISVKREVHGYKKLSIINRSEISRSELNLPPMEYDTFGLYLCADPATLSPVLDEKFGPGVHALSHALLAVAPLFAAGLTRSDLECDHSFYAPTQVVLFDERAGGSGCVERLWNCFFEPSNNILESAIELLEECSSCACDNTGFDGGCPACLHASNCINFNNHLSRSAAIIIGKRMIERIKMTERYQQNAKKCNAETAAESSESKDMTPRRKARSKAMRKAKEMQCARERQFVVGRPSWPLDSDCGARQEHE